MENLTKEELQNCEGLEYLTWDMFDSPDSPGSGYNFMEREPVLILDAIVKKTRWNLKINRAYMSKTAADKAHLTTKNSHRVGKAVELRVTNAKQRMRIIELLAAYGVKRIGVSKDQLYFDTDDLKPPAFMLW